MTGADDDTDPDISKTKQIENLASAISDLREEAARGADAAESGAQSIEAIKVRSAAFLKVFEKATHPTVYGPALVVLVLLAIICAGVATGTFDFDKSVDAIPDALLGGE